MAYSLANLNQMSQEAFVDSLGSIFEHTPEIPAQVWHQRPFQSVEDLHAKMASEVNMLPRSAKMMLVFAHPDLGSRVQMTNTSAREQVGAGLDQLTPTEYLQFKTLNQTYRDKFGFPFIIAVKKQTKESILAAFAVRLQNTVEEEFQRAIAEITDIAWFRLIETVAEP